MATNFPGSVDTFAPVSPTTSMSASTGGRTHSQMHTDEGDAIEAIQSHILTTLAADLVDLTNRMAQLESKPFVNVHLNTSLAIDASTSTAIPAAAYAANSYTIT